MPNQPEQPEQLTSTFRMLKPIADRDFIPGLMGHCFALANGRLDGGPQPLNSTPEDTVRWWIARWMGGDPSLVAYAVTIPENWDEPTKFLFLELSDSSPPPSQHPLSQGGVYL